MVLISSTLNSAGLGSRPNGTALAPTVPQLSPGSAQGRPVEPLRPACTNWMPGTEPCAATKSVIRRNAIA